VICNYEINGFSNDSSQLTVFFLCSRHFDIKQHAVMVVVSAECNLAACCVVLVSL